MNVAAGGLIAPAGARAQQGADGQALAIGAESEGVGVPRGGDRAFDGARGKVNQQDSVDAAAGHVESSLPHGEGVRGDTVYLLRPGLESDGTDDGLGTGVDDGDGVAVGVGDVEAVVGVVPMEAGGVEAGR